jgi:UrcA family protein
MSIQPTRTLFVRCTTSLLLAAIVGKTPLAYAADFTDPLPTQVLSFSKLDLNNQPGAKALFLRIVSAARRVCNPSEEASSNLASRAYRQRCVDESVARAVADVHSFALTRYYSFAKGEAPAELAVAPSHH